jgi:hypothetical protein
MQYKDYTLKKNTTLILNICELLVVIPESISNVHVCLTDALYHDPNVFENPEEFNPDRFIASEYGTRPGMDTDFRDNFLFGGGRVRWILFSVQPIRWTDSLAVPDCRGSAQAKSSHRS